MGLKVGPNMSALLGAGLSITRGRLAPRGSKCLLLLCRVVLLGRTGPALDRLVTLPCRLRAPLVRRLGTLSSLGNVMTTGPSGSVSNSPSMGTALRLMLPFVTIRACDRDLGSTVGPLPLVVPPPVFLLVVRRLVMVLVLVVVLVKRLCGVPLMMLPRRISEMDGRLLQLGLPD